VSKFTSIVSISRFIGYFEDQAGVVRTIGQSPVEVLAELPVHCDNDDMLLVIGHKFVQWMFGHHDRAAGGALALS
jgi:hypothetical protein